MDSRLEFVAINHGVDWAAQVVLLQDVAEELDGFQDLFARSVIGDRQVEDTSERFAPCNVLDRLARDVAIGNSD